MITEKLKTEMESFQGAKIVDIKLHSLTEKLLDRKI